MNNYTTEENETIEKMKKYLKTVRILNKEKCSLEIEYNDEILTIQSIKYSNEATGGYSQPKDKQITSRIMKRDIINKRLELFNDELEKFMSVLYLLNTKHRNIINTYVTAKGYTEMISTLNNNFCISKSTYKRNFPDACLALAKYLNPNNPPDIDKLNQEYIDYVRKFNKVKKLQI